MEFSRQEFWSGFPFPTPRDLLNPGIKPTSLMSAALADEFFTTCATWEATLRIYGFAFWSLSHFEFIFVYDVRKCPNFILLYAASSFPSSTYFFNLFLIAG